MRTLPSSEAQLGKEPPVLARLELLLEHLLGGLVGGLALGGALQGVGGHHALDVDVQGVARGHEVRVVDGLDKGLHLGPASLHLLAAALGHLRGPGREALESVSQGARDPHRSRDARSRAGTGACAGIQP